MILYMIIVKAFKNRDAVRGPKQLKCLAKIFELNLLESEPKTVNEAMSNPEFYY